jgi:hypothetical protein
LSVKADKADNTDDWLSFAPVESIDSTDLTGAPGPDGRYSAPAGATEVIRRAAWHAERFYCGADLPVCRND